MSEMVKRVAAVLEPWLNLDDHSVTTVEDVARYVIEAMREPTAEMIQRAHDGDFDIYWNYALNGRPGGAKDVWRAMINVALAEAA